MKPTNIIKSTRSFEDWLGDHISIVVADLRKKHLDMAIDPFVFLRATFYRWAQLYPVLCPELMDAPIVRAIMDAHLENFSSWRDTEARLIWGSNDFDEAYPYPYTSDLVRLATSAKLAIRIHKLGIGVGEACDAILDGYRAGLKEGIKPFVLAEEHLELGTMARARLKDPRLFWAKLDRQVNRRARVPDAVKAVLMRQMPEQGLKCDFGSRTAGEGSLGRQRFVALADWNGGRIAREAKIIVPSACRWVDGEAKAKHVGADIRNSQRAYAGDPFVVSDGDWTVRRLAPDCSRIEFFDLPSNRYGRVLLSSMGRDIANVHLGTEGVRSLILADLRKRGKNWLHDAVRTMGGAVREEHLEWKKHMRTRGK